MSKLSAFFKQNKTQVTAFEVNLESFEQPIELRIISGEENKKLQNESMVERQYGRNKRREMDGAMYNENLAMASITMPDLTDAELQDTYGASGPRELYNLMFNWAEQTLLIEAILEKSGFNQDINKKIDKAKN